jgi:hypothetical protein
MLRERFLTAGSPARSPEDAALQRSLFLYEVVEELYRAAKFDATLVTTAEIESIGKVADAALEHQTRMLDTHASFAD